MRRAVVPKGSVHGLPDLWYADRKSNREVTPSMKRTRLRDRQLPDYTPLEERLHTATHILGALFGIAALTLCILRAVSRNSIPGIVSGTVYGTSLIVLYTMSSLYHGLRPGTAKKVLQVLDHCAIYFLIAGSYTPVVLGPIRAGFPGWGWAVFGIVWGCAALGCTFTAIDPKKFARLAMICYLGMGWCIVAAAAVVVRVIPLSDLLWLLSGGAAYTLGAVLYGLGRRHRGLHAVFHIFVLAGSLLQFPAILHCVG